MDYGQWLITQSSPNSETAWHWINFHLERQETSLDQIPPLTRQIESDEYAQQASPDVLAFAQRLPRNMPFLSLSFLNDPQMREIFNRFQEAVRQVVVENADVQTTLDEAQSKLSRSSTRPVQIMYNLSGLLLENGQNSIIDFVVVHPYPCFEWGSYDYYPRHTPVFTDAIEQADAALQAWAPEHAARLEPCTRLNT